MNRLTVLNDAQRELVAEHTGIVKWAIFRHIRINDNVFGLSYDDLFQEGCISLCVAAATYDGERAKFTTYAQVVVKNGLLTYCSKIGKMKKDTISISDFPPGADGELNNTAGYPAENIYDAILSDAAVFRLLESVKPEYSGITKLGIEALELKVKGYTGAEIARLWGVEQNKLGAWISRAKEKLRENERFMAELEQF